VKPARVVAGAAIVALVAAAVVGVRAGAGGGDAVPTVRVARTRFTRTIQAEGTLRAVKATPITTAMDPDGPFKIAWLVADGTRVAAGEPIARFDPTEMEKELADGQGDRRAADERTAKTAAAGETTRRNLERDAGLAGEELEKARTFQSTDAEIYSRFEIVSSEIDATLAEKRQGHAEAVKGAKGRLAQTDLDLLALERRKADLRTDKAERGLRALTLVAPHDGIVVLERDWRGDPPRVGDTCWAGEKIAEIPDLAAMEAEIAVLEADAGGLAVGQRATVVVEGKPDAAVSATVRQVDALAKPRQRQNPVQFFGAVLSLERTDPALMKPGQRVAAAIVLADEESALVLPRQAVVEKDGRKLVYRKCRWGAFAPVEVTIGATALGRVHVTGGLEAGDEIAVVDPTTVSATPTPGPAGAPRPGGA
jgi:multidrug efflux pump subunit AcrA (membrane-fusion protein)